MTQTPKKRASEAYLAKLRDPRWQKKRLEILSRDEWTCQACFDSESTLHVHHRRYLRGREPWEYADQLLVTLCEKCHQNETDRWPEVIEILEEVFKNFFMASDAEKIASSLINCSLATHPVLPSVIEFTLSEEKALDAAAQRYFSHIREEINRREKETES